MQATNRMRDWHDSRLQSAVACELARTILRCSSTNSETREVQCSAWRRLATFLRTRSAIDHIGRIDQQASTRIRESRSTRIRNTLHTGQQCSLNRIIVLGASEGRRFVQIEADTRHVELIFARIVEIIECFIGTWNQTHV